MAARIAGIGIGLFILGFLWVLSIFLCMVLSRARGAIANLGYAVIFLSAVVTLVLVLLPRGVDTGDTSAVIYDNQMIGRTALVTVAGLMVGAGLVGMGLVYAFEPQKAKALKMQRF